LLASCSLAAFVNVSASAPAEASVIAPGEGLPALTFDSERALLAGTGCRAGIDAWVDVNGSDVSILTTNMAVQMVEGDVQRSAMKSCTIRVPATLAKGLWVTGIHQHSLLEIEKTSDASVSFSSTATLFGFPEAPVTESFPSGLAEGGDRYVGRDDTFLVNTPWYFGFCNPNRPLKGLFQANLMLTAQRRTGDVTAAMDDRFDVSFDISEC
jgi:hypothetical protein